MSQVTTDRITTTRWSFEWSDPILSNDLEPKRRLMMRFKTYTAAKIAFYTDALTDIRRVEGDDATYERIANVAWSKLDHGKTTPYDRPEFISALRQWLKINGLP